MGSTVDNLVGLMGTVVALKIVSDMSGSMIGGKKTRGISYGHSGKKNHNSLYDI